MVDVDAMRQAYRRAHGPSLRRRRLIAALCAAGMADFAVISLFQVGALRRLPDPPLRYLDSAAVVAGHKAFALGGPDGPLGALLYALQLVLASWGGTARTGRSRLVARLLALVSIAGIGISLDNLRTMIFKERRVCSYCFAGAGLNVAIGVLAVRDGLQS